MRLLVSVRNTTDAAAALEGGADIIDAKDPEQGALGAVAPSVLAEIIAETGDRRPVSAALGEAPDSSVPGYVAALGPGVVSFVKLGFARGVDSHQGGVHARLLASALAGTGTSMVLAAYADGGADRLGREAVLGIAAASGAAGVLLDTADKRTGRGLFAVVDPEEVAEWITMVHRAGLFAAVAGSIGAEDIALVRDMGADVAGVRGAACEGGRNGQVSAGRVRALAREMRRTSAEHLGGRLHEIR